MLGCHDFCGHYEWTFHYLRRQYGDSALEKYWASAIASDAQRHYIRAAQTQGLQGLFTAWSKTGVDEQCDWTVALNDELNWLRLDMRNCPSKGYLIANDLNADEDYCDHCQGWIGPALTKVGLEVSAHEHNHCGQCWWEIRERDRAKPPVVSEHDIRIDERWGHGYLDRYRHHQKVGATDGDSSGDACAALQELFRRHDVIAVVGPTPLNDVEQQRLRDPNVAVFMEGKDFAACDFPANQVRGVLLDHQPDLLEVIAAKHRTATPPPLLLHLHLPGRAPVNWAASALPRALPILPLLIRTGAYRHQPGVPGPNPREALVLLAVALGKDLWVVRGETT